MNSEPVLTARQMSAQWQRNMIAAYPHSFTFVEAYRDSGGTTHEQFEQMSEWARIHGGYQGVHWTTTSSPIGGSLTYWFRDAETAMLFKLTFVGTDG